MQVPQGFGELWPHNEPERSTDAADHHGQEIESSLQDVLTDDIAIFREFLDLHHQNQFTTLHEVYCYLDFCYGKYVHMNGKQ